MPKLPNSIAIPLTRILLIVYSLLALVYVIYTLYNWYGFGRKVYVTEQVGQIILSPILIPLSLLLLFGLVQNLYAAIIINTKRMKAWEHSLIGTILATIVLSFPMFGSFVAFENFYTPLIGLFWLLLTIVLFWRIAKLRKLQSISEIKKPGST